MSQRTLLEKEKIIAQ